MHKLPRLGIVVPCYNEEDVLYETSKRLYVIIDDLISKFIIREDSFIVFVDDGSTDLTWRLITNLCKSNRLIKGIKLSKNFGHQNALMAGLMSIKNDIDFVISIDADLQQDENSIYEFVEKYKQGYDIVSGIRVSRDTDSLFKKVTANFFYDMMKVMGVKIIKNHADYRLLSKKVLDALTEYSEVNLFLRGIFPTLGFKSLTIKHTVRERFAGKSKYSLKKMLSFALEGITSFSIVPVRGISFIGFLLFVFSLFMSAYVIFAKIFYNTAVGWASTVLPIYFIGGIQLLSLGLIGEYIGKIYLETKKRPRYLIEEIVDNTNIRNEEQMDKILLR